MADPVLEQLAKAAEVGRRIPITLWVHGTVLVGTTVPAGAFLTWLEGAAGAGLAQGKVSLAHLAPDGTAAPQHLHLDQAATIVDGQKVPVPNGAIRVALDAVSAFTVGRPPAGARG